MWSFSTRRVLRYCTVRGGLNCGPRSRLQRYTRLADCGGPAPLTLHSSRLSCNGRVAPLGTRDRIVSLLACSGLVARTCRRAWVQAPAPLCAGRATGQLGPSGGAVFCLNGKGCCASRCHLPDEETEAAQPCHSGPGNRLPAGVRLWSPALPWCRIGKEPPASLRAARALLWRLHQLQAGRALRPLHPLVPRFRRGCAGLQELRSELRLTLRSGLNYLGLDPLLWNRGDDALGFP